MGDNPIVKNGPEKNVKKIFIVRNVNHSPYLLDEIVQDDFIPEAEIDKQVV